MIQLVGRGSFQRAGSLAFKPARREEPLPTSWIMYQLVGRDSFRRAGSLAFKPARREEPLPTRPSTTSHLPAPPSQSPSHDRPRSLKAQLTEIIRSSPVNFCDTDSNHQSQQAPSISASSETHHSPSGGDHSLSGDQPENQPPNGEYHQSEDRSSHSPSSHLHHHHSPHSQTHFHHHQPHVSVLKKPTIGNSNSIFSPLSKELTVDLDPPRSSPPPPDIPPRPASLCIQSTRPPLLPHPHHPSSSILYNKDHQYSSHFIDYNPRHSFPAPPHQDGTMDANQSINPPGMRNKNNGGTKSFIYDHLKAMEICGHPESMKLHGFTSAAGTDNVELVPLFTFAKTTDTYIGDDPEWSKKKITKLLWRGSTTGAEFRSERAGFCTSSPGGTPPNELGYVPARRKGFLPTSWFESQLVGRDSFRQAGMYTGSPGGVPPGGVTSASLGRGGLKKRKKKEKKKNSGAVP
ncbi:Pfam:DUF821 [Puccinia graminis f. sp. tritici]|uniref:Pfam:DUF821 n=1 Tax=Puccinia graminis f. sp. tritici TaxID=56615 RepID=A0A5B0NCG3_PUCGR|nr:Pfam:DUF821 [Puccinia graminis f. sp. tritici]